MLKTTKKKKKRKIKNTQRIRPCYAPLEDQRWVREQSCYWRQLTTVPSVQNCVCHEGFCEMQVKYFPHVQKIKSSLWEDSHYRKCSGMSHRGQHRRDRLLQLHEDMEVTGPSVDQFLTNKMGYCLKEKWKQCIVGFMSYRNWNVREH